jgi:hypothetical protein
MAPPGTLRKTRCENGTRRDRKTGDCVPTGRAPVGRQGMTRRERAGLTAFSPADAENFIRHAAQGVRVSQTAPIALAAILEHVATHQHQLGTMRQANASNAHSLFFAADVRALFPTTSRPESEKTSRIVLEVARDLVEHGIDIMHSRKVKTLHAKHIMEAATSVLGDEGAQAAQAASRALTTYLM